MEHGCAMDVCGEIAISEMEPLRAAINRKLPEDVKCVVQNPPARLDLPSPLECM